MSSTANHETLLTLLSVARENRKERKKILSILNLEPMRRKIAVNILVTEMRRNSAPPDFVDAWDSLQDDTIADAAKNVIEDEGLDGNTASDSVRAALILAVVGLLVLWLFLQFSNS